MLSIHWLYRRSCNFVVKMLGVDIIMISYTTSTFNMADVNILERDSLMATPMLKSNTGGQKVCKEKNRSWLFGVDRKIRPSGSLASLGKARDAKQWPSEGFFYPHLTPMKDSYSPADIVLLNCSWIMAVMKDANSILLFYGWKKKYPCLLSFFLHK